MTEEKTISLVLTFHLHQPIGNFNFVIEDAFKKAYGPLIDNIFNYSDVKVTLHFSGNILEWFLDNKPEYIEKLKIMAKRGQIELISGGYYEPVFAIIPHRDRLAQIKKLSALIKKEFGLEAKGAWLSERVWEPNYPTFLNEAGLKYILVDDNHLRSCGLTEDDSFYSYITEDEGKTIRIFPINEELRYLTPWKPTYLSVNYLRKHSDKNGDRLALLMSDAEKMGVWGSTHEICYVDGKGHWEGDDSRPFIPSFFEQIINNEWIKSITLSEYMNRYPAKGLVYIPTASYDKMEEWVLPTEIRKDFKKIRKELKADDEKQREYQFLKGGFWRYFLVKYPESNNMHKKMLHVRNKLIQIEDQLENLNDKSLISSVKLRITQAWDEIYKAQCNDCYWHGLFGGVYLQFLRFSVYTHLINAEKLIDEMNAIIFTNLKSYIQTTPLDFNKNSKLDVIIESDILNVYINPSEGGTIFELDYKPLSYNLLNTLTRWYEAYHEDEEIEEKEVMIDKFRKSMLRLRFFHDDVSPQEIESNQYYEFGDFINANFRIIKNEKNGLNATLEMEQEGTIKNVNSDERFKCLISKSIFVENNTILIKITGNFRDQSLNEEKLNKLFKEIHIGIDVPFFFNGDPNKFVWESSGLDLITDRDKNLLEPYWFIGDNFRAYDETYDLSIEILASCNTGDIKINKFPIIAYVFTDEGYKKIYQGINIIPQFKLDKTFEIQLKLKIN